MLPVNFCKPYENAAISRVTGSRPRDPAYFEGQHQDHGRQRQNREPHFEPPSASIGGRW
jgi:hypothetical protein